MKQHGVLVLRGEDRRGALAYALRFLVKGTVSVVEGRPGEFKDDPDPVVEGFEPANITMAWVRGVGPFGGVMLRFEANDYSMHVLEDPDAWEHVKARVAETNGDEYAKMDLIIRRSDAPRERNCTITHQVCHFETVEPLRVPDTGLRTFTAILAGDGKVDICQHDRVFVSESSSGFKFFNAFRLYDYGGRGKRWLQKFVEDAVRLAFDPAPALTFGHPDAYKYFERTTLKLEQELSRDQQGYAYACVHCEDRPGLFARLASFLQTASGADGRTANRAVLRSCCRGIGGEAILLLVVSANAQDARELDRKLGFFLQSEGILHGVRPYMAVVRHSTVPPTVIDQSQADLIQAGGFTLPVNTPGALFKFSKSLPPALRASVFHLDGRERIDHAEAPNGRFRCTYGVVVPTTKDGHDQRGQVRSAIGNLRIPPISAEEIWFQPND